MTRFKSVKKVKGVVRFRVDAKPRHIDGLIDDVCSILQCPGPIVGVTIPAVRNRSFVLIHHEIIQCGVRISRNNASHPSQFVPLLSGDFFSEIEKRPDGFNPPAFRVEDEVFCDFQCGLF